MTIVLSQLRMYKSKYSGSGGGGSSSGGAGSSSNPRHNHRSTDKYSSKRTENKYDKTGAAQASRVTPDTRLIDDDEYKYGTHQCSSRI